MDLTLQDIAQAGKHYGGLSDIWLAVAADVSSIPDPEDLLVSGNITMQSGKTFITIVPIDNSITYSGSTNRDGQGIYYDHRLSFDIGKAELVKELTLAGASRKVVAIAEDNNGDQRIIGSEDSPAHLTYGMSKNQGHGGTDRYSASITWKSKIPALHYTGTIPTS